MSTARRRRLLPTLPAVTLAAAAASAGLMASGCRNTPVVGGTLIYSPKERYTAIGRNWSLESRMLNEDLDRILLLRPTSGLTEFNVP